MDALEPQLVEVEYIRSWEDGGFNNNGFSFSATTANEPLQSFTCHTVPSKVRPFEVKITSCLPYFLHFYCTPHYWPHADWTLKQVDWNN